MSRKTTFEERIEIVEYVTKDKHSYSEAAEHFQVSYQQARMWVRKAEANGYPALMDNRGHRKQRDELTENEQLKLEIRQLKVQLKEKEIIEKFAKNCRNFSTRGEQTTSTGLSSNQGCQSRGSGLVIGTFKRYWCKPPGLL
ncbi:hypothetical protein PESHB14_00300 [Pediococcus ethanolidurans]